MEWMIKIYKVMGTSLAPGTNYGTNGLTTDQLYFTLSGRNVWNTYGMT